MKSSNNKLKWFYKNYLLIFKIYISEKILKYINNIFY